MGNIQNGIANLCQTNHRDRNAFISQNQAMSFTNNGSHAARKKVISHAKINAIGKSSHYDTEFKLTKGELEFYSNLVLFGFNKEQRENEKF